MTNTSQQYTPNVVAPIPEKKKDEKETNPVKKIYDHLLNVAGARWILSIVILGLSAAIVAKKPEGLLLVAAAYNLAIVRALTTCL
jgi:hypothetical protein